MCRIKRLFATTCKSRGLARERSMMSDVKLHLLSSERPALDEPCSLLDQRGSRIRYAQRFDGQGSAELRPRSAQKVVLREFIKETS